MAKYPFPVDPQLTAMTVGYSNTLYIADKVMPRITVGKRSFKWWEIPVGEEFKRPDTKVGRKGRPNQVSFSATEKTDSVEDFGLEDPIPQQDIDEAPEGRSPVDRSVVGLTNYIHLDREVRVAGMIFNPANYVHKITLAGGDRFSDYANSDPLGVILAGFDSCLIRPNVVTFGQEVWTKIRQHPKIVKAVYGNAGDSGVANKQQVADLLEVEELLVGPSRLDTSKKGQAPNLARIWGKHISMTYRDLNATTDSPSMNFGFTAEHGSRVAGQKEDSNIGLRGGQMVRVGESVKELIAAKEAGYFIENAID